MSEESTTTSPLFSDTDTQNVLVAGLSMKVPAPFKKGYKLREVDAGVLNAALADAIRSNISKEVKEAQEKEASIEEIQAIVTDYAKEYDFGMRRGGGRRPMDPVERELREIGSQVVRDAIIAQGFRLSDVPTKQFNSLVDQAVEANPDWRQIAQDVVKRREATAGAKLGLDLSKLGQKDSGGESSDKASAA